MYKEVFLFYDLLLSHSLIARFAGFNYEFLPILNPPVYFLTTNRNNILFLTETCYIKIFVYSMIFNDRRPLEKMHLNFPRYVLTNVRHHPTHPQAFRPPLSTKRNPSIGGRYCQTICSNKKQGIKMSTWTIFNNNNSND